MGHKRKREDAAPAQSQVVAKPAPGTKVFSSGKAVRDGLAAGTRQALVAFHQQILTPQSKLPLAITDPTVLIIQHYFDVSPTLDEIFNAWQEGDKRRDEKLAESAVLLLAQIIRILTPLPFFRTSLIGILNKILASQDPYHDLLNHMIQSGKREQIIAGLSLASAAINVEPLEPIVGATGHGVSSTLPIRVWNMLVEGGTVKGLGKLMVMRKRNKEGTADYGDKDPMDKPDIRHLCLDLVSTMLPSQSFHAHARPILKPLYFNILDDPPLTIYRLLTSIWRAISLPSPGIARRVALALLDENAIEHLLSLLDREEIEATSGKSIADMTSAFLEQVTATPGKGICFQDEGWYPRTPKDKLLSMNAEVEEEMRGSREERLRKGLHNRILSNVVRKLGSKVVDDKGRRGDWVLKVMRACPEIVAGYWPHSALAIEPRLSARWTATMAYVGRIISLPPPSMSTFRQPLPRGSDIEVAPPRLTPPTVETVVESILPSPLTKQHVTKGLQHPDGLVQYLTALTLARGLQKLDLVQRLFRDIESEMGSQPSTSATSGENPWAARRRELEMECRRRVPDLQVLIGFAQKSATLAPAEPETDEDHALVAKSAMITEAALRLFGLYHRTLPSLAQEVRFDVGRLLVSSSSNKAERRERQQAKADKAGSVIGGETGSVASVGTAGTAGMGGGFGYARGDVKGFEALSQVHVVELLSQAKGWQWTNKAAGSQYTYFYHVVQLHLSTRQPVAQRMTTELLRSLLSPTLLFEHDPSELDVWLSSLPRLSDSPAGIIQQVHLLSFLDDCVRRCAKTPYRYLEDGQAVLSDPTGENGNAYDDDSSEATSPLLMAVVEQFIAKVLGQHIATEAAVIVINYLRRVLIGLVGKMKDTTFISVIVDMLEGAVKESKAKGQPRLGLEEAVGLIKNDLSVVVGVDNQRADEESVVQLLDDDEWRSHSFERACLDSSSVGWRTATPAHLLSLVHAAPDSSRMRYGRLIVHLVASTTAPLSDEAAKQALLEVLRACLVSTQEEPYADKLKRAAFASEWIRKSILSSFGNEYRAELDGIVLSLHDESPAERDITGQYAQAIADAMAADRKHRELPLHLAVLRPWTRFLESEVAKGILELVLKKPKRLVDLEECAKVTIGDVVRATRDAPFAFGHLATLLKLDIISPLIDLLRKASTGEARDKDASTSFSAIDVSPGSVRTIIESAKNEAFDLLSVMVEVSPSAVAAFRGVIEADPAILSDPRLLQAARKLVDLDTAVVTKSQSAQNLVQAAVVALQEQKTSSEAENVRAGIDLLVSINEHHPQQVLEAVREVASSFTTSVSLLARALGGRGRSSTGGAGALAFLVEKGLRHVVRACSNDGPLPPDEIERIENLHEAIRSARGSEIDVVLAEPVITSIIQERLTIPSAVQLADLLSRRCTLKASFVRQHLQLLFDSKLYITLSGPSSTPSARLPFVNLLEALFLGSPYASCQPNFIEPLLPLYRGTLALPDRKALGIFKLFESQRRVSVTSVYRYWSASGAATGGKSLDSVLSLDAGKVMATCCAFPLRRDLVGASEDDSKATAAVEEGERLYDPAFVLPMLGAALVEGEMSGLDWVEVLRGNALGLAVCALASRDAGMRTLAGWVLARALAAVQITPFHERDQLVYTLRLIRHVLPSPDAGAGVNADADPGALPRTHVTARLPTLTSLFIAHALRAIANPGHFLYPLTSRFLLQRPTFDAYDVPMLFGMLYSYSDEFKRERGWIIRLLRDGVRSEADWRVLRRRNTWSLLATMFFSSVDPALRRLILQAMESMLRIPSGARTLVHKSALIPWLTMQWDTSFTRPSRGAGEERRRYLELLELAVIGCVAGDVERAKKASEASEASGAGGANAASGAANGLKATPEAGAEEKDADSGKGEKWLYPKPWVLDTGTLLKRAIPEADIDRLDVLARIALRLSSVPDRSESATLLPLLANRLRKLIPTATANANANSDPASDGGATTGVVRTVEYLFRLGLAISPEEIGRETKHAVDSVQKRMEGLGGEVGEWVRMEKRKFAWDEFNKTK